MGARLDARLVLGALGVVVGVYGAYLLLSRQETDRLVSAAIWLAGGVLVHDGLIALTGLLVVAVGARVLPAAARPAATVALIVLGPLTILAVPVLGRFGARSDNATLLDRDYWLGWSVIVLLALVAVVVDTVLRARRRPRTAPVAADEPVGTSADGPVDG